MSISIHKTGDVPAESKDLQMPVGAFGDRKRMLSHLATEAKQIASRAYAVNIAIGIAGALLAFLMLTKIVFLFGGPEHLPVITHPLQDFAGHVKHIVVSGQGNTLGSVFGNLANTVTGMFNSQFYIIFCVITMLVGIVMSFSSNSLIPLVTSIAMACGMYFVPQVMLTLMPQNTGQQMENKVVGAIHHPTSLLQASRIALIGEKARLTPAQTLTFDQDIHQALLARPGHDWKIQDPSYAYRLVKSARLPVVNPLLQHYQIQRAQDRASYNRWNDDVMDALYAVSLLLALLFVARHVIGSNSAVVMDFLLQSESGPDGYVRASD